MTILRTYTATEARNRFSDVFDEAHYGAPVVVRKGNKAVAVIPFEMLRHFEELEARLDKMHAQVAMQTDRSDRRKTIEQLKRELDGE